MAGGLMTVLVMTASSLEAQTYKAHPQGAVFKQNPQTTAPNSSMRTGAVPTQAVPLQAVPAQVVPTQVVPTQVAPAQTGANPAEATSALSESDSRWGVGYSYPFVSSTSLPSISLRMWQNQRFGLMGAFGLDTFETYSQLSIMGKVYCILLREEQMNFFANAAVGWLRGVRKTQSETEASASKRSSHTFELGLNLGVEYFLIGNLKSLQSALAVHFESGLSLISTPKNLRFKTVALTPFKAGFTFYF